MKQRTRILSVLLALIMCLSLLPATALAKEQEKEYAEIKTIPIGTKNTTLELHNSKMGYGIFKWDIFDGYGFDTSTEQYIRTDLTGVLDRNTGSTIEWHGEEPNIYYDLILNFETGGAREGSFAFVYWGKDKNGEEVWGFYYIVVVDDSEPEEPVPPEQPTDKTCEVWFNPNGGTVHDSTAFQSWRDTVGGVDMLHTLTDKDCKLPSLPMATRDGYTLDGWYTAKDGGAKVSGNQDLSSYQGNGGSGWADDQIVLWAHWTQNKPQAQTYRIDFFPNGGLLKEVGGYSHDLLVGDNYDDAKYQAAMSAGIGIDRYSEIGWMNTDEKGQVTLPAAERAGYTLDGWFILPPNVSLWDKIDSSNYVKEVFTDFKSMNQVTATTAFADGATLVARWVPAGKDCTVTYDWNGAGFLAPIEPQTVAYGAQAPLYSLRADFGRTLKGWATEDGTLWTSAMKVTEDITLYAVWDPAFEDDFSFSNSDGAFNSYNVSETYLRYLVDPEPASRTREIRDYAKRTGKDWKGSCFGMSAVYAMQKAGGLDVGVFQSGAKGLRDLEIPIESNNVRDLVNFYMLSQMTSASIAAKNNYFDEKNLSTRYSRILSAIQGKNYTLLGFNFTSLETGEEGGHAIIAKSASNGRVEIWDPNCPGVPITLTISGSTAKFSGPSGLSEMLADYNNKTELKYVMPLETRSQNYDKRNLQSVFKSGASAASAASAQAVPATLTSTVGDFTVSSASGKTAVVKNGEPSGDLALTRVYIDGAADSVYRYELDAAEARSLTVTLSSADAVVQVVTDDVYARIEAPKLKVVTVSDEAVTTSSAASGKQSITMVSEKLDKKWNTVTVTGSDTGFQLGTASGQLTVASDSGVSATVTGENSDTWETGKPQTITASPEGTVLTTAQLSEGAASAVQPSAPAAFPFTDVEEGRWFRPAVEAAYNAGLVNGLTETTYGPQNTLTLAQSVTLAARIYAEAHGETAPSGGTPWYKAAYDYCVEKGVIDGTVFALADMTRTATRFEMVTILDGAVPAERMDNSVAVESIPDLAETDAYGEIVYRWYRAGILSGNADGSFTGERDITRAEVAKILCAINRLG